MSLPKEFQKFEDITIPQQEQIDCYQTKICKPFASIYRGMGTFWVILQSLANTEMFCFTILGGANHWEREENLKKHQEQQERIFMSAADCAEALQEEIRSFWGPLQKN